MTEHVNQEKLHGEFRRLLDKNGSDVEWVRQYWNDICKFWLGIYDQVTT